MFNRQLKLVAIAAALATPAVASAGQQGGAPANAAPQPIARTTVVNQLNASFKGVDTNGDGFLSQAEIAAGEARVIKDRIAEVRAELDAEFTKADTNKDGQLSKAEFVAAGPQPPKTAPNGADVIAQLDKNKDGKISVAEFSAARLGAFDELDTNHDGTLSVAEREAGSR